MLKLNRVDKPASLAEIAYNALRESILTFKLVPGITYSELKVAEDLGLSRTPIREALLRLSAQGLITFLPRKGFELTRYKKKDLEEVFELRQMLEPPLLKKITRKLTDEELSKLAAELEVQRKAAAEDDTFTFLESDRVFHNLLYEFGDNIRLMRIVENIQDLCYLMGAYALVTKGRMEASIYEHEFIVKAMKGKDPEKAARAMSEHLEEIRRAVLENFTDQFE